MLEISRRRLISISANVISIGAITGPCLPGLLMAQEGRPGADTDATADALATLVHDLFPHDDIHQTVYADVARTIIAQEQGSTGDLEMIQDGLRRLNEAVADGEWRLLEEQLRLQALRKLTDSEFLKTMLQRARSLLYLRPEIWQLVGYGGNALQQGGYLTRGFDDIDWLN